MAKAVTTYVKGIKCDNEECGWKDPTVPYEDYPKYIDKPCPCCGANLLTRQDYLVTKRIIEISKLFGNIEVPDNKVNTLMRVNMNGKNQVSLDISQIDSETKDEMEKEKVPIKYDDSQYFEENAIKLSDSEHMHTDLENTYDFIM